jgi:hypothetical protein
LEMDHTKYQINMFYNFLLFLCLNVQIIHSFFI